MSDKLIAVVKDLISHKHEEEWFEFKVNWFEPHELGEYISALSNVATLQGRDAFVHNRWLDGNAPMFTAYQDRIEILSRGNLPPKQTIDGFFAGESIPVNQALSDVFIKLHITEHTGRGVPRITEAYGKDVIRFNENSIVVTVPYERLGQEVYGDGQVIPPVDVPVNAENVPVGAKNAPVNAENVPVEDEILSFCMTAKNVWEIAEHLGYKDKRSVRKNLNPLIKQGRIAMTIPDKPNSRFQKYVTIR